RHSGTDRSAEGARRDGSLPVHAQPDLRRRRVHRLGRGAALRVARARDVRRGSLPRLPLLRHALRGAFAAAPLRRILPALLRRRAALAAAAPAAVSEPPRRRYEVPDAELERDLEALVERAQARSGRSDRPAAVRHLLVPVLRFVSDHTSRADLKLISNAVKELRHAFRVFAPYQHVRKVAVFGSARTRPGEPGFEQARRFATRIAAEG